MTAVMAPRPPVEAASSIAPGGRPARSTDGAPAIRLVKTSKAFGRGTERVVALEEMTLDVQPGEFVCLVGASGCGKSTLLNLVCGLDAPTSGRVELPRGDRPTLIFQEAALFPWLTASENVELPMRLRGVGREERRQAATELLERVQLGDAVRKRPHELSGGMRQRVALARALAHEADILCMDEPFGALDAMTRDLLHDELERLWRDTNLTILFVTHNVREAVRLGDRVVLLSSRPGRVVAEFPVEITRPRRIESPEVSQMAIDIRDRLSDEVRRHGAG
jgi:NitT/TauT family transport system ATP-binding protein